MRDKQDIDKEDTLKRQEMNMLKSSIVGTDLPLVGTGFE